MSRLNIARLPGFKENSNHLQPLVFFAAYREGALASGKIHTLTRSYIVTNEGNQAKQYQRLSWELFVALFFFAAKTFA